MDVFPVKLPRSNHWISSLNRILCSNSSNDDDADADTQGFLVGWYKCSSTHHHTPGIILNPVWNLHASMGFRIGSKGSAKVDFQFGTYFLRFHHRENIYDGFTHLNQSSVRVLRLRVVRIIVVLLFSIVATSDDMNCSSSRTSLCTFTGESFVKVYIDGSKESMTSS